MTSAEKLSITLPHDLAEMIRKKVRSGDYASNSEVIRDALRVWQEHEKISARKREWLRSKIECSLADHGPPLDPDEVFADLERRYGEE
jgi:antitoxin ParD1/3/4